MTREKNRRNIPLVNMTKKEREEAWDELFEKEEGIILEFDSRTKTGKVRSLQDGSIYKIDGREMIRTKIELWPGDKVVFAPIQDPEGNDYARIIEIIVTRV